MKMICPEEPSNRGFRILLNIEPKVSLTLKFATESASVCPARKAVQAGTMSVCEKSLPT